MGKNTRGCEALLCENTRKNCSLSFFTFPVKEPERLEKWLQNIMMKNSNRKEKCLCSDHFEENSFTSTLRTRLLPGAVPSIQYYAVRQNSMNRSNYEEPTDNMNKTIIKMEPYSNERNEQIVIKKEPDWDYDSDIKNEFGLEFEIVNKNIKTEHEKYNSITIENNVQVDNVTTELDSHTDTVNCIQSSRPNVQNDGTNISSYILVGTDLKYPDVKDERTFQNIQTANEVVISSDTNPCVVNNFFPLNINRVESHLKKNDNSSILRQLLEVNPERVKEYANKSVRNDFDSRYCKPEMRLDIMKRSHLKKYIFIVARPRQIYLCKICMKCFYHKPVYTNHQLLHAGRKPFSCKICKRNFLFEFNLRKHNAIHTKGALYCCLICKTKLKSELDVIRHQKLHSVARLSVCKFCGRHFEAESLVTHKAKPFRCEMCRKCYTIKAVLMIPQKTYFPNKSLMDHQKCHSEDKPFQCDQCGKRFKSKSSLTAHQKTHSEERAFQCEICGKRFKKKACLTIHRTHYLPQHFWCDICEKCFNYKDDLSNHRRRHFGEKIFQCDLCEKSFHQKYQLFHHKARHLKEGLYSCKLCNKCFKRKSFLLKHQKKHLEDKKFPCEYCAKSFNSKPKLVVHKISHYGELMIRQARAKDC